MIYFTSDHHFGHENVIQYSSRPFENVDDMTKALVKNWNDTVKKGDTVYCLGDFSLSNFVFTKEILLSLTGEKHVILGNHDSILKKNKALLELFASVHELRTIKVPDEDVDGGHQLIVLCHYAMRVWDRSHYGSWQLYGHSHNSLPEVETMRSMDIGVDAVASRLLRERDAYKPDDQKMVITAKHRFHDHRSFYRPISYDEVKAVMKTRLWEPVDHHRGRTADGKTVH